MDPASLAPSQFELPPLQPNPNQGNGSQPEAAPNIEALPPQPASGPSVSIPADPPPVQDPAQVAAPPVAAAQPAAVPTGNPAVADDLDIIEKEWVDKAKEIVARTRNDPHSQNNEITRFKADYMKKRYGKDLKVGDA